MKFHPLLEKNVQSTLSPAVLEDPSVQAFLRTLNASYFLMDEGADQHEKKPGLSASIDLLAALRSQISERKNIEKELNRTVNLLVTLLSNLHSGIVAEDEHRKILFSNDRFCDLFHLNVNADALKGKDCKLLAEQGKFAFKDPDAALARLEAIVEKKEIVLGEELELANGDYLERDFIPLYVHQHYKGHLWHYKNITARKKDEQKLLESNSKLQLLYNLIDNTSDAIQAATENGQIFYINQEASLRLGIAQDKAKQYSVRDVEALFKERDTWDTHVAEVKAKDCLTLEGEHFNQTTGKKFPVEVTVRYVKINDTGYLIANSRDITARKQTEQLLKTQEEKYRNIIANMHLGLVEVDTQERIQYANNSFQVMSGYTTEELQGEKASSLFVRHEDLSTINSMMKKRAQGVSDMYELCVHNKQGEKRWWMISGAPNYNDKGALIGSIGIHLDITGQKTLALDLEQAKIKAEQASKAKEAFLANMSHEIRTPLNAIKGMLRELHREPLTARQSSYVTNSLTASKHLLSIITNILDISKIEAGELNLEEEHFVLKESVERVINILKKRADDKGIYLRSSVSENISPVLIGDTLRIEQILLNLLGNAIKFTSEGGVSLDIDLAENGADDQVLQIRISDTGIGMEEAYLATIFSKFSQEDRSTSRKYGGTGLGMAITHELVQLMQGTIGITSEKGIGTTYAIGLRFPKGDPACLRKQPEPISEKELLHTKVLLVEDNDMNRLVAQNTLSFYGCDTTEAIDGQQAIVLLQQERFDVILMDIQMPGMDGIEATRMIREVLKIQTPVIALTANAFKTEIEKCKAVGMNDYITKPFDESQLVNTISKLVNRNGLGAKPGEAKADSQEEKLLYDLSGLESISRGDKSFVTKMIALFIEQADLNLAKLEAYSATGNYREVSRLAHKMKPGIENMRISSISAKVKALEVQANEHPYPASIQALVEEIAGVVRKVVEDLKTQYPNAG